MASIQLPHLVQVQPAFGFSLARASASAAEMSDVDLLLDFSSLLVLIVLFGLCGPAFGNSLVDDSAVISAGRDSSQASQLSRLIGLTRVQTLHDQVVDSRGSDADEVSVRSIGSANDDCSSFDLFVLVGGELRVPDRVLPRAGFGNFSKGGKSIFVVLNGFEIFGFTGGSPGSNSFESSAGSSPVFGFQTSP
jgi:hypothetical protein